MQNNIIEKWKEKELQELCDIEIGKTPSRSDKNLWDKDFSTTNTWLSIADLNNTENKQVYTSKEQISDLATQNSKLVKTGTLLLSFKLTIGRVAFAGKDLYTNEAIAQLPTKNAEEIDKNYLYYYLQYYDYDELLKGDVKVKGKTLNKEKLKHIRVIYPDIDNQQRIVKVLDEAFENIEKAKQNTLQNLNNAKELFESKLTNVFTKNVTNWEEKTLGEICVITAGQSPESRYYNTESKGLPFYQGKKEFTNKYIGAPTCWTTKTTKEAQAGDILMSVRAPVGSINYATERCCIGRGLASIRKTDKISNDFLFYYLLSMQKEISGHDGAVFNSISRNEIAKLKINLPNLSEQQKIVQQLDELQEQTKKLEQIYTQKLQNLDELKQAILQKAFNGEL